MSPEIMLTFSGGILAALAIVLFGAPFLPPLRPLAFPILVILIGLGNIFVFTVVCITFFIYWKDKRTSKK